MRRERKIIRLRTFDYSYECSHYLTICTKDRGYFLGNIKDKNIEYSPVGEIAKLFWTDIPNHFPHVVLDEFIIMPNHIHGIIKLDYSIIHTSHGKTPTGTCRGETQIGTCHGMSLLPDENPEIHKIKSCRMGS